MIIKIEEVFKNIMRRIKTFKKKEKKKLKHVKVREKAELVRMEK